MGLHWGDRASVVTKAVPGGFYDERGEAGFYIVTQGEMRFALVFSVETQGLTNVQVTALCPPDKSNERLKGLVGMMTVEQGKPVVTEERSYLWRIGNFCRDGVAEDTGLSLSLASDGVLMHWLQLTPPSETPV
jgi:hypothetical protein